MSSFLICVVSLATFFDLRYRRIPNILIYPVLLVAFLISLYRNDFFIALISIFAVLSALLFGRYVGAGDIKLAVVIASYSHILNWSQMWIYGALISGGVFGLIFRRRTLPFAPFMALGMAAANLIDYLARS